MPPQKKAAQIGHLAAENREQFRVSAARDRMRLRPGSDQIAYGLIYRAVFFSRRDDPRGIKSDSIFIISSVAYPKILCIPAIERPGSPTRHKAISSYLTLDISYSVILPDT